MSDYVVPAAILLLPHIGGVAGSLISEEDIPTWLKGLDKSSWRPPEWVPAMFGPAWRTVLYCSMGYASYLVWRDGGGFGGAATLPLTWYGVQLALNWTWTPLVIHSVKWALANNLALCGCVAGTVYMFFTVSRTAAYLLLPYWAWVSFAGAINFRLWLDKREED